MIPLDHTLGGLAINYKRWAAHEADTIYGYRHRSSSPERSSEKRELGSGFSERRGIRRTVGTPPAGAVLAMGPCDAHGY